MYCSSSESLIFVYASCVSIGFVPRKAQRPFFLFVARLGGGSRCFVGGLALRAAPGALLVPSAINDPFS